PRPARCPPPARRTAPPAGAAGPRTAWPPGPPPPPARARTADRRGGASARRSPRSAESAARRWLRRGRRALLPCSCASLQQIVLDRVVGDVSVGPHPHLLQNARAIGADGLHTQEQLRGDLRDAAPFGELAEDLKLPLRENAVPRLGGVPPCMP